MKFFKLTLICGSVLSLSGCLTAPTNPDTTQPAMSAAYVDLLIEKARAEERARVMAELAQQNKDDKRFSDIKISQLESKVDQLTGKVQAQPAEIQQETPIVEPIHSSSADPLLEQWKQMYAQQDEVSEPAVKVEPTNIKESSATTSQSVSTDDIVTEILNETAADAQLNATQVNPVYKKEYVASHLAQVEMDRFIRQCFAGQHIPDPYLGSLPEIMDASAQPGDVIRLPTLCKWSRTAGIITKLQLALSERGFLKPSPPFDLEVIDGIWGVNTLNSLINYQKSKGLAYGQLSIESLVDLGVIQYSDVVNRKGYKAGTKAKVVSKVGPKAEVKVKKEPAIEPGANVIFQTKPKVKMEPEVKVDAKAEQKYKPNKPQPIKQSSSDSKHCYVNQVIPGNYRGKISEVIEKNTGKVGYIQELPTLCKKDRSTEIISKLQQSLSRLGYLKGVPVDGVWNKSTLTAIRAYQKDKGLAYGQLSIEVLEHLKVF